MKKWLIAGGLAVACLAFFIALNSGFTRDPKEVPFKLQGKAAPEFQLPRIGPGEQMSLASLQGKPVVMNFWASWCGPCKMEHPVLEWGARTFASQVQFVGVVFEDTEVNAQAYLSRHGSSFPQLLDPTGSTAVDYGAAGVPETYFIDGNGVIRHKHIGPINPKQLQEQIAKLTQSNGSAATGNP